MTHARTAPSILATRLSRFFPAVVTAAALSFGAAQADAAFSQTALDAINAQLARFANEKTTPPATPKVPTVLTAKADDLVYAVYQVSLSPIATTPADARDLVETALTALAGKVRADKDKIAPRILNAAVQGTGLTSGTDIAQVALGLVQANNSTPKLALTTAGRAAVVGQALKSASATGTGGPLGSLVSTIAGANEASKQSLAIASLKTVGLYSTGAVESFTDQLLDDVAAANRNTFALNVAKGVLTNPGAAGAVIGGRAADLAVATPPSGKTVDDTIHELVATAIKDPKLAKSISQIVGRSTDSLTSTTPQAFTAQLVTDLGIKATIANRGLVAAGAVQNVTGSAAVNAVIDAATNGATFKPTDYALFAGAAVNGTRDNAADVVAKVSANASFNLPSHGTVKELTAIGVAAVKTISTTSPSSADDIARALVDSSTVFEQSTLLQLAKDLAKATPTSAPTVGFSVAGVASKLTLPTPQSLADFGAAVVKTSTKAAINISQQLAAVTLAGTSVPVITDFKDFAVKFVKNANITTATAPAVVAGIAVTSTQGNANVGTGQSAGAIVTAAAQATELLKPKITTIAGAVAIAVDVERIADIGGKVAAILQPTGSTSKLPKLTTISTLATALTKAINTKPFIPTVAPGVVPARGGRVDEIGELAAELTRGAIAALTINGVAPNEVALTSALTSIGSGVMKGLSAALLLNGGNFAADLKDSAGDIAGAIAQTIQAVLGTVPATELLANSLTRAGGPLELALAKAAKKFGTQVTGAFAEVRGATGNADRLVLGTEALGVGEVANGKTGKYEIGSLVEPETPVQNL